jgi:7-cyano-7-deazaguanine synthase in queuosine biosynthesis
MIKPRLILCSGISIEDLSFSPNDREIVSLDGLGPDANVNIRVEDVAKVFSRHLSARLADLIEIASYVYAADCATRRGTGWQEQSIETWSRDFHFVVPVRDITFWQRDDVKAILTRVLKFLSNDEYRFDFTELIDQRPTQEYLQFSEDEDWPFYEVDRVLMFSGGLDSLAGAVSSVAKGENLVLVSHRSVGTLDKRQKDLFRQLKVTYHVPMLHIPVWINKEMRLGREPTQRTRSFLYGALGTIVGESLRAGGVRFFENGIVSLNLPVADEVLRARASRTTHPVALTLLQELFRYVTERDFHVDNPFLFHTKTDVVETIAQLGGQDMIAYTCSCAHSMFKPKTQWHCGNCSQCIDRRIAILAAGQTEHDLNTDYESDVFLGNRAEGYNRNIAVGYVRHAIELNVMSSEQIAARFNAEFSRAARSFNNRGETIRLFVELHKRHGQQVARVLSEQVARFSNRFVDGGIPEYSMSRMIVGGEHLTSTWKRFAQKIISILQKGVPIACQTDQPANEPRLQEICDGILSGYESDLVREFPFLHWSSSATKPDWSSEVFRLWVELKYVRAKKDIREITEAIAADITKYSDNQRHILFVIYDPHHIVLDEAEFSEPIKARQTMEIAFIR